MMQQNNQKENIYFYHEVFANSLAVIQDLIKTSRTKEAKEIMIFNYIYALSLNEKKYTNDVIQQLKDKEIYELLNLMVLEQKKADLIPTQSNYRDSYYTRILSKIQ
jgi:hypothetical protein